MRAVWVDEGDSPNTLKLKDLGITRFYLSPRDPNVTAGSLQQLRDQGFQVGIYRSSGWDGGYPAQAFAHLLSEDVHRLGEKQLAVMVNIEKPFDHVYVALFLKAFRALRPYRMLGWTMEAEQGGWISPARDEIIAANVTLFPESYDGDMNPYDPDGIRGDLTDWGFPDSRVSVMHDAKELRPLWRGCAFTQNRLP